MFPYAAKYYRLALLFLSVVMIVLLLMLVANTSKSNVYYLIISMLLMPCAACFIFVMVDIDIIHGLMTYGEVMMYALLVWAVERFSDEMKSFNRLLFLRQLVYCLIGVILFLNIRFANLCYLKSNILQEQEISCFTSLITRIQQIEGYSDRLPVVYINEYEKHSDSFIGVDVFDVIDLVPYGVDEVINAYSWKKAMKVWCGFDPILGEEESFIENPEVKKMPCYPNDGSIKCIDNTIVVKFAE